MALNPGPPQLTLRPDYLGMRMWSRGARDKGTFLSDEQDSDQSDSSASTWALLQPWSPQHV